MLYWFLEWAGRTVSPSGPVSSDTCPGRVSGRDAWLESARRVLGPSVFAERVGWARSPGEGAGRWIA